MSDVHMLTLRQARGVDWDAISALLAESGLPTSDLGPDKLGAFLVAEDGGELAGIIGLQIFGTTGLLRSLVVAPKARRAGLGGKLVGALESAAQTAGIRDLWLLTIDAGRFFERQGFAVVERESVPDSIRDTDEFTGLCPSTAFLMHKALDR
jgi:amino-acid N-acetyltransferase